MIRLIDATKLLEDLTKEINEMIKDMLDDEYLKGNVNFSVLARDMIREQPTVYDVSRVLQEYKKLIKEYEDDGYSFHITHKVEEIIRSGRIDEN